MTVDVNDTVRVIMRFAEYTTDGWPMMYHCHNLMHISQMMWQFIIVDPTTSVAEPAHPEPPLMYPVPSSSSVSFHAAFTVTGVRVLDLLGREVLRAAGPQVKDGAIDVSGLAPGQYIARLEGLGTHAQAMIVRE